MTLLIASAPPSVINFTVVGKPSPAGSKTAIPLRREGALVFRAPPKIIGGKVYGHPIMLYKDDASETQKAWIPAVKKAATVAWRFAPIHGKPLQLAVVFYMPRPQAHFRTGKFAHILKDDAPKHHLQKPDATKMLRCLEDAISELIWADDCIIVDQQVTKLWADDREPGADVTIAILPD